MFWTATNVFSTKLNFTPSLLHYRSRISAEAIVDGARAADAARIALLAPQNEFSPA
jgi:hypothetical protein